MNKAFGVEYPFKLLTAVVIIINNKDFLFVSVGASVDPAGVTMLDSIKIYGKTKEQFGWPDEPPEDFPSAAVNNVCSPNLNQSNGTGESEITSPITTSATVLERYTCLLCLGALDFNLLVHMISCRENVFYLCLHFK